MEEYLQVGVIASTHGIRGEVKVFPTTDDAKRFQNCKQLLLDTGKERMELEVEGIKYFKQFVILKFKGIDSINDVECYKGKSLLVTRENAVKLRKGEYFIADLIGLIVCNEAGEKIGVLEDVLQTGANDVYNIRLSDGRELLLPAIRECVLEVDVENRWMKIHIMEGLLD